MTNWSMLSMPLVLAKPKNTEGHIQVEQQTWDRKCITRFIAIIIAVRSIPAIIVRNTSDSWDVPSDKC